MRNKTDLQNVKRFAKGLLNVSVLETEYSPMIVSHPFTKCGIVTMLDGDDFCQADITKSKSSLEKWKNMMAMQIDSAKNVFHIYYLLNDSYRLLFLRDVFEFLSIEDFSEILGDAWVISESANQDANVTKKELLKLFKLADKSTLMSESELEIFNDFEDSIVVYRGVSTKNKSNIKALSWTTSFGKAKWFADRWGEKGKIYSATINKENILAYFDRKGEDEVIVDFTQLQNLKTVTKPISTPQFSTQSLE